MTMELRHFRTSEELTELHNREIEEDTLQEAPHTAFIESTLRNAISGHFAVTQLDVLGFPADAPLYVYCMETCDDQLPYMHVRSPLKAEIDMRVLHDSALLLLERYRQQILDHGRILISADETTSDAFDILLKTVLERPVKRIMNSDCGMFYMTAKQRETLMEMTVTPPTGFTLEPVNVDRDGEFIHAQWKNGINSKVTKERLRCFPSICIRDSNGQLAGWAMSGRFGQISNEFVVPEHRGKGLSKVVELGLAQLIAREGRRVFKYVDITNAIAYESSLRSPLWTLWKEDDKRKPIFFRRFAIEPENNNA